MSLRVRAGPADAEARAVFPAFGCPSGGLWYNSELEQPASTPHLVRCLHCASLNGRSALRCWSCEAELPAGPPVAEPSFVANHSTATGTDTEPDLAPPPHTPSFFGAPLGADLPTAPGVAHASSHADAPFFNALPSAVAIDERFAAFSQHRRRVPRRLLGAAAIAAFTAIAGAGAYLIQRPPPFIALETDPARGQAALAAPEPQIRAEPVTARLAGPSPADAPPDAVRPDAGPLAATELLEPAAQAAAPPMATPPPTATLTAARGNTARGTRNARHTTAPVPVPIRSEPLDPVRPSPPAQPRACTATVAALGLCQAASAQPKE